MRTVHTCWTDSSVKPSICRCTHSLLPDPACGEKAAVEKEAVDVVWRTTACFLYRYKLLPLVLSPVFVGLGRLVHQSLYIVGRRSLRFYRLFCSIISACHEAFHGFSVARGCPRSLDQCRSSGSKARCRHSLPLRECRLALYTSISRD